MSTHWVKKLSPVWRKASQARLGKREQWRYLGTKVKFLDYVVQFNGLHPRCLTTVSEHQSTAVSAVPTVSCPATPKSANLAWPSELRRMFPAFTSRWIFLRRWRYSSPAKNELKHSQKDSHSVRTVLKLFGDRVEANSMEELGGPGRVWAHVAPGHSNSL